LLKKDNEQGSGNSGSSSKNFDQFLRNTTSEKFKKMWMDKSKLMQVRFPASSLFSTQPGLNEGTSKSFSPIIDVKVKDNNPLLSDIYNTTDEIVKYKNYVEGIAIYVEGESARNWNSTNRPLGGLTSSSGRIDPNVQKIFNLSKWSNKGIGFLNPIAAGISFGTAQTDEEKRAAIGNMAGSIIGGGLGQALIPIPGVGFAVGSFLGSFAGTYVAENYDSIIDAIENSFRMQGEANLIVAEGNLEFWRSVREEYQSIRGGVAEGYQTAGEALYKGWNNVSDTVSDRSRMASENLRTAWNNTSDAVAITLIDGAIDVTRWGLDFFGWGGSKNNEEPPTFNSSIPIPQIKVPLNNETITYREFVSMTSPQRGPFNPTGVKPDSTLPATQGQSPINVTLSPGTVQLSFSSSEPDYDELSTNIGIRITKAVQQAIANSSLGGSVRSAF